MAQESPEFLNSMTLYPRGYIPMTLEDYMRAERMAAESAHLSIASAGILRRGVPQGGTPMIPAHVPAPAPATTTTTDTGDPAFVVVNVTVPVLVEVTGYLLDYGQTDDVPDYTAQIVTHAAAQQFKLLGWGHVNEED